MVICSGDYPKVLFIQQSHWVERTIQMVNYRLISLALTALWLQPSTRLTHY
ncbi:hypothetical protein [Candidatus Symbiopectobacterium sp.]|uniref:hypothetical protein n=1 Tax=Candidatus Symbiopectobacterium sp. TaxID=2816440 RepID=UPI0025B86A93|nr:hypothetical protein [Candidatus Symbiopectobacterium sp.]